METREGEFDLILLWLKDISLETTPTPQGNMDFRVKTLEELKAERQAKEKGVATEEQGITETREKEQSVSVQYMKAMNKEASAQLRNGGLGEPRQEEVSLPSQDGRLKEGAGLAGTEAVGKKVILVRRKISSKPSFRSITSADGPDSKLKDSIPHQSYSGMRPGTKRSHGMVEEGSGAKRNRLNDGEEADHLANSKGVLGKTQKRSTRPDDSEDRVNAQQEEEQEDGKKRKMSIAEIRNEM